MLPKMFLLPKLSLLCEILLFHHGDGTCRAFYGTDSTSLTICQVYLQGNLPFDHCIRAIEPAQKAGGLIILGGDTLLVVNYWP